MSTPTALLARADGVADTDRNAHSQPHQHNGTHMHDLTADGHRRGGGHTIKPADDEQIRHTVERLQKVR